MKIGLFFLLLCSSYSYAHDIALVSQHIAIKKQHQSAWQHDVLARAVVSRKFDFGLQGTYLERFNRHESRGGAFAMYHLTHELTIEARYLKGKDENDILPQDEYNLTAYYALTEGFTPFVNYRDIKYSMTKLHTLNLGLEIEKFPNFIIIPQIMGGKATFDQPAQTKNVHSLGLKVMYYREKEYSLFAFGYQGKEAAQGIIGQSNIVIDTLTGGMGAGYFITPNIRSELTVDHTDYQEINNQFVTTTLNLRWIF